MFDVLPSRITVLTTALALILGTGAGPAGSDEGAVANVKVVDISAGPSVFESEEHRCQTAESAAWGYRQEPSLAVNPVDPQNMVAIWRQDQWGGQILEGEGGAALSDVVAYTTNGGTTWSEVVLPDLGVCGPAGNGASDPTVSFGPDGTAYAGVIQFGMGPHEMAILAYRSTDGGRTWEGPFTVQEADSANDRPTVVADHSTPGRVYAIWTRLQPLDAACLCAHLALARSDDGGETWTGPMVVDRAKELSANGAAQLSVLADGSLVALTSELTALNASRFPGTYPASIYAVRSEDGGETWARYLVAEYRSTDPSGTDPDSGRTIDAGEFFIEQAVGSDGRLYAAWHHNSSTSKGEVFAARSDDGGISWTEPSTVADVPAQVLDPVVAVADDGTVGVLWADLRNDDDVPDEPDDEELTTDWWFAASRDGGETWSETHVSGPFDLRHALFSRGNETRDQGSHYWLGEYYGLAAAPGGFAAAFVEAREPRGGISQTDVRFARIRLRGPHG
ncbi:MAG: glycoside hydrolase [Actinobacteria bacterium]|nr:glycoside hydrolase [Actinomycetota bacterium]